MHELEDRHHPLDEHMAFQSRFWAIERLGWIVLAAIVAIALSGAFGFGPLSSTTAGNGSLTVEYDRFQRITHLVQFRMRFSPVRLNERQLSLGEEFAESYEITDIEPRPTRSRANGQGLELIFDSKPSEPFTVTLWAHPSRYGTIAFEARAEDGQALQLSPFVYP